MKNKLFILLISSISCTLFGPNNNSVNHISPSEQRIIGQNYLKFLQSLSEKERQDMEKKFRSEEEAGEWTKQKMERNALLKYATEQAKKMSAANSQQ